MTETFTPELAVDLWYQALAQEIGIVIPVLNPATVLGLQIRMYEARKDMNDPRLDCLMTHISEDGKTIYIYKKGADLD